MFDMVSLYRHIYKAYDALQIISRQEKCNKNTKESVPKEHETPKPQDPWIQMLFISP